MNTEPKKASDAKTERAPVYLVFGGDEYFVSTKARRIVDQLCPPDEQAFGLEIMDAGVDTVAEAIEVCKRCLGALRTVGFLSAGKVVWLRGASFLGETVTGKSADVKAQVDELVQDIKAGWPDGQHLVISAPKVSKRFALYKACKEAGLVFEYEKSEKDYEAERNAKEVARKVLAKAGLRADGGALECFLERVGTDTRQIVNEVEKLRLYLGEEKIVTRQAIEDVVSPSREAIMWGLADAVAGRDLHGSLTILRRLFYQKESAIGMIFALEQRFRLLATLRSCMKRGFLEMVQGRRGQDAKWRDGPELDEFFGDMGKDDPRKMHPYRTTLLARQARQFSLRELERIRKKVLRTHERIVSSSVSQALLMEVLVVDITGRKKKA